MGSHQILYRRGKLKFIIIENVATRTFHVQLFMFRKFYILYFILFLQIIYGGKVLNQFDKRIIHTYMNEYFGEFLFNASQVFEFCNNIEDKNSMFTIPYTATNKQEFLGELSDQYCQLLIFN